MKDVPLAVQIELELQKRSDECPNNSMQPFLAKEASECPQRRQ